MRHTSSYRDIGLVLSRHGVISRDYTYKLSRMASLRNILVHMYSDIDYRLLYKHSKRLIEDAKEIISQLIDYMKRNSRDP